MKPIIINLLKMIAVVLLLISLVSCDFDISKNHLSGGEILNDEKISQIKDEILSGSMFETEPIETEYYKESTSSSDTHEIMESDDITEDITNSEERDEQSVYWTKSGSVWHTSKECHHLRNSTNIVCGSIDEAKESGKTKECSSCSK